MAIDFVPISSSSALGGKLLYERKSYSFIYQSVNVPPRRRAALVVDHYLQIEFSLGRNELLFVHGLHNYKAWQLKPLQEISFAQKSIAVESDVVFQEGVGYRLIQPGMWETIYDQQRGLVYIGTADIDTSASFIEFASGCIASFSAKELIGLWLKPVFQ